MAKLGTPTELQRRKTRPAQLGQIGREQGSHVQTLRRFQLCSILNQGEYLLEVILGTALKVISNYTNHIADTDLDDAFLPNVWEAAAQVAE